METASLPYLPYLTRAILLPRPVTLLDFRGTAGAPLLARDPCPPSGDIPGLTVRFFIFFPPTRRNYYITQLGPNLLYFAARTQLLSSTFFFTYCSVQR